MVIGPNWTNEFSKSFKNLNELFAFLEWKIPEHLSKVVTKYPLFIPLTLAKKIKIQGPEGVLAKEFLPDQFEIDTTLNLQGYVDPIGDKTYLKAPQLIHRYHSRALFTPTNICPVHCRYCFRKNELNTSDELFQKDFQQTLHYLENHPEISEIIFTGGDPLTLSDDKIEKILTSFSTIKSIKDIRFHSRFPVILPERLDSNFINLLKKFTPHFRTISIAIHVNHACEFDDKNISFIKELSISGIQMLSQTVLLKGINNDHETLLALFESCIELKIRPYYLHHPDQVKGGMHFYLSLSEGREIYQKLRDNLPGWAIPEYVIDIPGGHGKVQAYNPEAISFSGKLISRTGDIISLQEPDTRTLD